MKIYKEKKGTITLEVLGEELKIEEVYEYYCSNGQIIGGIEFYVNNVKLKERDFRGWRRDSTTSWRQSRTPVIMEYYRQLDEEIDKFTTIANQKGILEAMMQTRIR